MRELNQIRTRHAALAWWRQQMVQWPGVLVTLPIAARILGVSLTRVRALADEGRLTLVSGMPGGLDTDRWVPIDELIAAPFRAEVGRRGILGPKNRKRVDRKFTGR